MNLVKTKVTVWTLAWDNERGTDCSVFGSEKECDAYFSDIIERDVTDIQTPEATAIRELLRSGEIGEAYALWQATYKNELDTYNWGPQDVVVEIRAR
jgi:hypothetical protein